MAPSPRAVAIIIRDKRLLTVRRTVPGRTYYVLPGGSVEPGESAEEACRREAKEETGLTVRIQKKLMDFTNGDRAEHYFLTQALSGNVRLGEPEASRQSSTNRYDLVWVTADELDALALFPEAALQACRELLASALE